MSNSSSQKFIARNRAPRVQIEYDIELYGAEKKIQLPFVIGVMADLSGNAADPLAPVADRSFLEIDVDNFNDRLKSMKPRVEFQVPNDFTGEGNLSIDITFENMDDFSPGAVASKVEGLNQLLKTRTQLSNLLTYMDGKGGAEELIAKALNDSALLQSLASASEPAAEINRTDETGGLGETRELTMAETENQATGATLAVPTKTSETDDFTTLLQQAFKPKSERAKEAFEDAIKTLAEQALTKTDLISDDAVKSIEAIIAEIDNRLSDQVNRIMHHPDFQKLEGSWRGMQYLANNTETDEMLKIRFMSLTKRELSKTIRRYKGSAWDQSPLFKKIYDDEYGQFGGEPYGCLIGDYEFGNGPEDIDILCGVAQIAAAAHSPFIAAASPSIMQMGSWQEIANPRDLSKVFLTPDYAAWRSLRESEESIYLALAMPRFLARLPYGDYAEPVEEFAFQEDCDAGNADSFVWCNSAYAMGVNITRAFKLYGWCVRIRGMESGGMVEGLPTQGFPTDDGGVDMKSPTEVSISDRWEAELSRNGFMPLLHRKNSDFATFIGAQSLHKPAEYDDPETTANAALAARLPFILASCRFAHYLKCIVRDRIGSFMDRANMENWLNTWIKQYVDQGLSTSSEESKARRPLADAEIVLEEIEGNPSNYLCKLYIRPHYQLLEGLTISLRLLLKLPSEHSA